MEKPYFLLILFLILFSQCGQNQQKSQDQFIEMQTEIQNNNLQTDTILKNNIDSFANNQTAQNNIRAFGNLYFGMLKDEVEANNEQRQLLGKYKYNFNYKYNYRNELYSILIISDSEKVLNYDSGLKDKYVNLSKIITTKYGDPKINLPYPSVFNVQNSKFFTTKKWDDESKQIHLGIKENSLDSYSAVCIIFDSVMEKEEKQQLYELKNKDIIDASEKF